MLTAYTQVGLILLFLVSSLWLLSLLKRDASIIDSFWGTGFVIAGWLYATLPDVEWSARKLLILALLTTWGIRLSVHILTRNLGRGEDFRYRAWREQAGGGWWWKSYFKVFLLQGALIWLLSVPLAVALSDTAAPEISGLDWLALALWTAGFLLEAISDLQLRRFRSDPRSASSVLSSGLWRYSRHPNYFGEAVVWWGLYLFALAAGGWWTVFSPLLMTFLLVRVSGVRMLERYLIRDKPEYKRYVDSTSAFVPWFPRSQSPG